jgi:hypothetical protein
MPSASRIGWRGAAWRQLEAGDVAVAGQGTSALLYATERGRAALLGVLEAMRREAWADGCGRGRRAGAHTASPPKAGVVAAVNMARRPEATATAWPGKRWVARKATSRCRSAAASMAAGGRRDAAVPDVNDGRTPARCAQPTSLVDIAPTLIGFSAFRRTASTASPHV